LQGISVKSEDEKIILKNERPPKVRKARVRALNKIKKEEDLLESDCTTS
jgi:hypothetical protein